MLQDLLAFPVGLRRLDFFEFGWPRPSVEMFHSPGLGGWVDLGRFEAYLAASHP